jgi:ribonuclease/clavin/mitogillin
VPALRARWPNVESCKWPLDDAASWRPLRADERIAAGDRDLQVIHTPGHAPDHVCFWDARGGDLFGGDMVVAGSTVMIPAGRGGSLRAYLASLDRLKALAPARILPGHGPIVDRPLDVLAEYIAHRHLREAQVLACVVEGLRDPDAIVVRIYPDLLAAVRPAARLTIEAHLEKLREDGRI